VGDTGRGGHVNEGFEHIPAHEKSADVYLTRTGLDWLNVRPGFFATSMVTAESRLG